MKIKANNISEEVLCFYKRYSLTRIAVLGYIFAIIILFSQFLSCSQNEKYDSIENLAVSAVKAINNGGGSQLSSLFITKDQYIKKIYHLTEEGSKKAGLSAEDYWRIFVSPKRVRGIHSKSSQYENKKLKIKDIGPPLKTTSAQGYRLHWRVPINLNVTDESGNSYDIEDDELLGLIIEIDKNYYLMHILKE